MRGGDECFEGGDLVGICSTYCVGYGVDGMCFV